MQYNPKIHRRRSIRLADYDYSAEGLYFVTINIKGRDCYFGHVEKGKMCLSEVGEVANQCWIDIPKHYPDVILHSHVIMPNHVHGIIEISDREEDDFEASERGFRVSPNPAHFGLQAGTKRHQFQKTLPRSLGAIVRGYKIGVTKWWRANTDLHTIWQRNYYENIIRDYEAFKNITAYIENNPQAWKQDEFYKKGIIDLELRKRG